MRKIACFLFIGIFTFILPGSLHANISGIPLKDFPRQTLLFESMNVKSINLLEEIFLLPDERFNQVEAAKVISRVDQLPQDMLKKIIENRIHIILFNGKLTDHPSAQDLAGITPRGYKLGKTWDDVPGAGGSKLVLVKIGNSDKGMGHSSVNLELHELAHSLDRHVYDLIREDHQFLDIWEKEAKVLFPGRAYFLNYPEEYFAETFAMYYIGGEYRELLKTIVPKTYRFINELD